MQDRIPAERNKPDMQPTDKVSIDRLYREYQQPILRYLIRLTSERDVAEDLCQDTFLKVIRSWAQHDQQASLTAWVYRIATNTAYDYLRRRRRIRFLPLQETMLITDDGWLEGLVCGDEELRCLLAQIAPVNRRALLLYVWYGHTIAEIAVALGCSASATKTRLFRARNQARHSDTETHLNAP
jgi:RNA polymerase sigma-70 factor (ECF subfamily)